MTTTALLKIVKDRGLKIALKEGQPCLVGAAGDPQLTDELLAVLRIHREWIIEQLGKEKHG